LGDTEDCVFNIKDGFEFMKESNIYRTIKFEDNKVKYNDVTSANENYTAYD
jgi:hypothetical protein